MGNKSTAVEPPDGRDPAGKGEPPKQDGDRSRPVGLRENIPMTVTARAVERYQVTSAFFGRRGLSAPAVRIILEEE